MKKYLNSYKKYSVLMIGPYPPPPGGVATVIKNLIEKQTSNQKYNIKLFRIGRINSNTPFTKQGVKDIIQLIKFFFTFKFKNIDIFHIHTSSYWSFIRNIPYLVISKYLSNGKIVIHIHGGGFHKFYAKSPPFLKKIIKKILTSADYIIVTSDSWIPIIDKICGEQKNIISIPNGFDEQIFHPIPKDLARKKIFLPMDRKILLNIGSLENHKGQKYLIDSMREMIKIRDDILLYIVGKGTLEQSLKDLINNYNLEKYITLAGGNKFPEDIALWLNASDIFVLPSISEGNPTVMFECLACGKPFVGTTVGGIPDIIKSQDFGLLCTPGNSNELTAKILIALDTEWNDKTIITYAENFTWTNILKNIYGVYEKLLGE